MAQAVHAAFEFSHEHPDVTGNWLRDSKFLVINSVPDEAHLLELVARAAQRGIVHTLWREPDLDNELTSVALHPGVAARKLCANLPLALRQRQLAMTT
ncbi:peptidyl-tRNA hydrolase [Mycolicibacterium sphagni]|nr:peptidyl-tRNA hydrolase [Mycolicibacterium sphagni]